MAGDRERTAVLVIRAWIEGEPPQLKARITQTVDIASLGPVSTAASSPDEIFSAVGGWLEEIRGTSRTVTGP